MQLQAPAYQPRSVLKLVMVGVLAFTVAFSLSRLPLLSALFPHNAIAKPIAGYASLPLSFVANAGQTDAAVRFQVRAMGGTLYMGTDAITLLLPSSPTNTSKMAFTSQTLDQLPQPAPVRLKLTFEGANPATQLVGDDKLPGIANFFAGSDPAQWRTNVPTYGGVVYKDLYPGIDLGYTGQNQLLKGTYSVSPGSDPGQIRWRYSDASKAHIDATTGDLQIDLAGGETLIEHAPLAWQSHNSVQTQVAAHYQIAADGSVQFALGSYDRALPLQIDPILTYATYIGGVDNNGLAQGLAVDAQGNAYVTGTTTGNFPVTPGAFQTTPATTTFVAKLDPAGTTLLYATYLSGGVGWSIAVDSSGDAYVAGYGAAGLPVTADAYQPTFASGSGFVVKLNPTGSALLYASYLGKGGSSPVWGIATDVNGNAYISGPSGAGFVTTAGAFQTVFGGGTGDAIVVKLNANNSIAYATYLGGSAGEDPYAIAVDANGSAYVTGLTTSSNFPITPGAFEHGPFGGTFVAKLNPSGSALAYATHLLPSGSGSSSLDARGIAVDAFGNAFVTGSSDGIPSTAGAFQTSLGGGADDSFVIKLNAAGSGLVYATYLGGSAEDDGYSIAVDSADNAYVTGVTFGPFPMTADAAQHSFGGDRDIFVTEVNAAGSGLIYSTYLGGSLADAGQGIALDQAGNIYVAGGSRGNFPTTNGAFQPTFGGGYSNVVVLKFGNTTPPTPTATSTSTLTAISNALPDLTITSIRYVGSTPDCANNPLDAITVANIGNADAGTFLVSINGATQSLNGLAAGQSTVLYVSAMPSVTAIADSTHTIAESNENNNSLSATLPIPTQALPCTATYTPTSMFHPKDTIGVFRPSTNTFYLRNSNTTGYANIIVAFNPVSKPYPIVGDWNGDGLDTIGIYDRNTGIFYLRDMNTAGIPTYAFALGNAGDIPLSGRWSSAATHAGAGVFRPSNGLIYLKNQLMTGFADFTMVLGSPGDIGVAGDWSGQGFDTPGVYRPSKATFYLSNKTSGTVFADYTVVFGTSGDVPIAGDWIGQGHDGIGIFRPTNGNVYLRNTLTTGFADNAFQFGIAGDMPVAGHWLYQPLVTYTPTSFITPTATRVPSKTPFPVNTTVYTSTALPTFTPSPTITPYNPCYEC